MKFSFLLSVSKRRNHNMDQASRILKKTFILNICLSLFYNKTRISASNINILDSGVQHHFLQKLHFPWRSKIVYTCSKFKLAPTVHLVSREPVAAVQLQESLYRLSQSAVYI